MDPIVAATNIDDSLLSENITTRIQKKAVWVPYLEAFATFCDASGAALTTAALSWANQENKTPSSDNTEHQDILDNAITLGAVGAFSIAAGTFISATAKKYGTSCSIGGEPHTNINPLHNVYRENYDACADIALWGGGLLGFSAIVFGGLSAYSLSNDEKLNYDTAIIFPALAAFSTVLAKSLGTYYTSPPHSIKAKSTPSSDEL